MSTKHFARILPGLAVLAPAAAMAHPGHGGLEPTSTAHHLFELPHALWLFGGVVLVIGLVVRRRRPDK